MSERAPKPGVLAEAEALGGSDAARVHVRPARARLVEARPPRHLTHPTEAFVALRDDDEVDVDARAEPILAIVIMAGMAGILLTPACGRLPDIESLGIVARAPPATEEPDPAERCMKHEW